MNEKKTIRTFTFITHLYCHHLNSIVLNYELLTSPWPEVEHFKGVSD